MASKLNDVPGQNSAEEKTENRLPLTIEDSGIMNIRRKTSAMIFYITVKNKARHPVKVTVESEGCCLKLEDEVDCESMELIGGEIKELYPMNIENLTLIYPNLYFHDRNGKCRILVSAEDVKIHTIIEFNTMLRKNIPIPCFLEDYLTDKEIKQCSSIDEDALDDCKPVSCFIKYNGKRNFFNHTSRRCEKVFECNLENNDKDLPTVVYVPVSNRCRKLGTPLSKEDLNQFKTGHSSEPLYGVHGYPLNVQCHNGDPTYTDGWCKCHSGWSSAPFDYATFNPDIMVYHMCTIWTGTGHMFSEIYRYSANTIIIILLSTVLIIIFIIYVIIFSKKIKRKIKTIKNRMSNTNTEINYKRLQEKL
ncbi:uncharacterized protein LOC111623046 [Centruroides sculpturatus]|uniref:uncharacterized protein LOC111623046 n=1 Tax=Centruroides sculpturatus TaxID=218467 RepID=UPI000C6E6E72|nr:uncharacterized protein LOC111623046 [Centruroides sculpturatus]XP_023221295.1 uncharacterized protein LOC111623046 [Centruroides sculpturatus]XP_023221296.1 uncharacterized protein LOC111623046 [Centruroides sculpturatus]